MNILVIDAQGGGIGKQLVARIKKEYPSVTVTAVGTNSIATSAMIKAGADQGATGENSVVVACKTADVIIGPVGIVITDAMLGEITEAIAQSVAQAKATRILIPFNMCDTLIAGIADTSTSSLIDAAMQSLRSVIQNRMA
jgi:hypothetical protein